MDIASLTQGRCPQPVGPPLRSSSFSEDLTTCMVPCFSVTCIPDFFSVLFCFCRLTEPMDPFNVFSGPAYPSPWVTRNASIFLLRLVRIYPQLVCKSPTFEPVRSNVETNLLLLQETKLCHLSCSSVLHFLLHQIK